MMVSNTVRSHRYRLSQNSPASTATATVTAANGTQSDRRFAWDKKLTRVDYA